MFERASRLKLRFITTSGNLSHEDLWDLPLVNDSKRLELPNLNDLAKSLNRELKAQEEEDFVKPKSKDVSMTQLRFDIVKRVIEYKLAQAEASEKRLATKARNQQIMEILKDKEAETLRSKTPEELKAMLEQSGS